jgi:hypothetical protein
VIFADTVALALNELEVSMAKRDRKLRECYVKARRFLHDGAKSGLKRYAATAPFAKRAHDNARQDHRNAIPSVRWSLQGREDIQLTPRAIGDLMRGTGITRGDSYEMACLAASYVAERMPGQPMHIGQSATGHSFLLVGARPEQGEVGQLATRQAGGSVLDLWSRIFCPTNQYPRELQAKATKWQSQNKEVASGFSSLGAPAQWAGELTRSQVTYSDPGGVLPLEQWRTALDALNTEIERLNQRIPAQRAEAARQREDAARVLETIELAQANNLGDPQTNARIVRSENARLSGARVDTMTLGNHERFLGELPQRRDVPRAYQSPQTPQQKIARGASNLIGAVGRKLGRSQGPAR